MAKLIPFESLQEENTYYEDYRCGTACIPVKVLIRIDDTHLTMRYGVECPWNQVTKASPDFRYWDAVPTMEEQMAALWT